MGLKWSDSLELALALADFDDDPKHRSERVLEAVQQCWIAEML